MIVADITDRHATNVEAKSAMATPLRTGRFVVSLNREIFRVSESHKSCAQETANCINRRINAQDILPPVTSRRNFALLESIKITIDFLLSI